MPRPRALLLAACAASLIATVATLIAQATAPAPNAQQGHGTEAVFADGLYERELGPGGPQRWTTERATYTFLGLASGPASLEVRVRGQRTPIRVSVNGRELGTLGVDRFVGRYELPDGPEGGRAVVALTTEGFRGGDGRVRGAFVDRVRLRPSPSRLPSLRSLAVFVVPACVMVVAALLSGLGSLASLLLVGVVALLQGAFLHMDGALFSPYAATLSALLCVAALSAAAVGRLFERLWPGTRRAAFGALLLALLVQGIAASAPVMVASDVVFHANRLRDAAAGELFPVSVTQHAVPFRIPYGVAFYAVLAPLARLGVDPVLLVSAGAGLAGVLASVALFALLARRDVALAFTATVALQLLPGTFTIYSYGNLSNAFGQAVTVLFFCWWCGAAPGGLLVGAMLYAAAGISHLSSLIVLGALTLGLLVAGGRPLRAERTRLGAMGLGAIAIAVYYSHFLGLVLGQLPRLLEGGGQGKEGSSGPLQALGLQLQIAVAQFALPALLLAAAGLVCWRLRQGAPGPQRSVAAYLASVTLLALPAVVSPLEVRYLYALTLPIAIVAAVGYLWLQGRGLAARAAADLLVLLQASLAVRVIADCVFFRYRQ